MYEFACPQCGVRLRVKDRGYRGRAVDCPDCRASLRIEESGGKLHAVLHSIEPRTNEAEPGTFTPAEPAAKPARLSPALMGWGTAIAALVLLVAWINWTPAPLPDRPQHATEGSPVSDVRGKGPSPSAESAPAGDTAGDRLRSLGARIEAYRNEQGVFPPADRLSQLPLKDRFSWIALLMAAEPEAAMPRWDQSWRDPVNERFVRQRAEWALNPSLEQRVGEDRYPATHFVGVGGVGEDAPTLPARHPRAGMFGFDQVRRVEDVADGLANTMMVGGVTSKLGSWAAAGPSTVRPLTAEPYVNGPDGFGTGRADSMEVLMADGSVRTISAEVSAVVLRRMAAIADGFALDADVLGDPLRSPVPDDLAIQPEGKRSADAGHEHGSRDDQPIEVLLAPDERFPRVRESLRQRVVSFEQRNPVPLRVLLVQLEEMLGVPITVADVPTEILEKPVTLELRDVALSDILSALLDESGLDFQADEMTGITLRKRKQDSSK